MTTWHDVAEALFPDLPKTADEWQQTFPSRNLAPDARITRFAPSPTGYLHIGGVFSALISERMAHLNAGTFILRIEDTDKKREINDGITQIIDSLQVFGLHPDEGMRSETEETGQYGPYRQSDRKPIYQAFVKHLVANELAYPCFCTHDALEAVKLQQDAQKAGTGYYGEWAVHRHFPPETALALIQTGKPWVVRFRSPEPTGRVQWKDQIRGQMELPENVNNIVICKSDGLPTYHFAHVIDDHLMGVTDAIRGEEWVPSVNTHLQLFRAMGWKPPRYGHFPVISKMEDGAKRKLSKRKDPEATMVWYHQNGYPAESILEYLMNLANSDFEDWRKRMPNAPLWDFPIKLSKIGSNSPLFDMLKLTSISKDVISRMSAATIAERIIRWTAEFEPDTHAHMTANLEKAIAILSIDRDTPKPRKDVAKWSDFSMLFDYFYHEPVQAVPFPERLDTTCVHTLLTNYQSNYRHSDTREAWFNRIGDMCESLGFARNMKDFKTDPGLWKGNIADVTTVIRIAITGRDQSPDLWSIMQILGETEVKKRLTMTYPEPFSQI